MALHKFVRPTPQMAFCLLCFMLMACSVLRVAWAAGHWDSTYDEYWHLLWSERALLEGNFDREYANFISTTPVNMLNAGFKQAFSLMAVEQDTSLVHAARIPTVLGFVLLIMLSYSLVARLFNSQAGLLVATLVSLDANLITHGALVTVDIYFAAVTLWFVMQCMRYCEEPTFRQAALLALPVGLGFIVKLTTVLYLPVVLVVLMAGLWSKPAMELFWRFCAYLVMGVTMTCLIVSAGYRFHEVGFLLNDFPVQSLFMLKLQTILPYLYLPLPRSFVEGFDLTLLNERLMQWNTVIFDRYLSDGVWYYFPVTWFFKTPIAVLMLLCAGFVLAGRRLIVYVFQGGGSIAATLVNLPGKTRTTSVGLVIIVFLWLVFFIYFNFIFRTHVGLRYILMSLPLLYLLAVAGWVSMLGSSRVLGLISGCLVVALLEQLPYLNNALSFSNVLIYDKDNAYHIITDSNIDWGQNYSRVLAQVAVDYPQAHVYPVHILPGQNILKLNDLAGVFRNFNQFRWVREHLSPTRHLQHTHLLYDVSESQFREFLHAQNLVESTDGVADCNGLHVPSLPRAMTTEAPGSAEVCFDLAAAETSEVILSVRVTAGQGTIGKANADSPFRCQQYSLSAGQSVVYLLSEGVGQLCFASESAGTQWLVTRYN